MTEMEQAFGGDKAFGAFGGYFDRVAQSAKLYSEGFRKTWGGWCEPNAEPFRRAGAGRK